MSHARSPYGGCVAGLATQHHKLDLVAPPMFEVLGLEVFAVGVNTDVAGTFSGEIARVGSQWDAAVAKARMGMAATGLPVGLASEGSIAPLAGVPFVLADTELVVLVDDRFGIVVGEAASGFAPPSLSIDITPTEVGSIPFGPAGFPEHGLIVRPTDAWTPIVKGIHDAEALVRAISDCAAVSPRSTARVESDLRAHHYPYRREFIAQAANRLAKRLASVCPVCDTPGWGISWREPGARCLDCGSPTDRIMAEHYECSGCGYLDIRPTAASRGVDPGECARCNP